MACQASSNDCSPCCFRGIKETLSVVWCLVCKEGLCHNCREHHTALKVLRSHELIPIDKVDKLPEVAENVGEKCFEHDRKLEMFCSDHQEACCIRCVASLHKSCSNAVPLDDIIRDVESSVAFHSIQDGFNALYSKLDKLIEIKKNSIGVFKSQANDIKKRLENKHSDVVKSLERLKEQTFSTIEKFETMNCADTNGVLVKLNQQLRLMTEVKADLLQIKEKGTKLQLFLCLKDFEAMLSKAEDRLTFMIEKGELDIQELSFIPDKEFEIFASYESLGEVKSQKRPIDLTFGSLGQTVKINEVQQKTKRDMNKIKLQKNIQMALPQGCMVTNCVVLDKMSMAMLFTDYSDKKRLILFERNGTFLRCVDTESKPFDLTIVKDSLVAVTLPELHEVIFIDFSSIKQKITNSFGTVGECFGIDFCENRFAVSVKGYGIHLFNTDGSVLRTILHSCTSLAFVKSLICYVEIEQNILRCCDQYGEEQWKINLPTLFYEFPSITVDNSGLIYVAEPDSDDLFVVTNDGTGKYRKLLQRPNGLYNVNGICFNVRTQQLLVCTKRCECAVLYDISEQ